MELEDALKEVFEHHMKVLKYDTKPYYLVIDE